MDYIFNWYGKHRNFVHIFVAISMFGRVIMC